MYNKMLASSAVAALLLAAGSANAVSLAGKTVMVNLKAGGNDFGTQTVLVGPGDEGNYFGNTFFDLNGGTNGDQFVYSSGGSFCGIDCSGNVVWTLSNLDFGSPLTAFNILQQDVGPITIDSLTATSVSFRYTDGAIHPGVNVIGQFVAGAVPEPTSWALMIAGFAMVGAAARRRKAIVAV